MPQVLTEGVRFAPIRQAIGQTVPGAPPVAVIQGLTRILAQLRSATGHDFSQYKKSTIGRRVERRMAQHNIDDVEVYARFIKEHPDELAQLLRELLINVTSFFRDPLAFDALKDTVLPELLAGKPENYGLRIWVAGCATGEEAYSIAMLLRELMDQSWHDLKVQLYSTDLDDDAILTARAGLYPPNIAQDVSPERLRRFFIKEEAGYRVKKEIREMVVFAVQSVIKDPPFTRLDLLSCRNLLIYLEPALQERLIPAFHYALRPGGALLLSPSESIGNHTDLFEPIDRRWKIYRARPGAGSTRAVLAGGLIWAAAGRSATPQGAARPAREPQLADLAKRALLQAFCPAAVMTDLQGNVLFVHGDTGRYLRPAPGHPTHNLAEMAREGLQTDLRDALYRAATTGEPTLNREVVVRANDQSHALLLDVRPLADPEPGQTVLLVSFRDAVHGTPAKPVRRRRTTTSAEAQRVQQLERELASARENLGTMLEEQQASNEELKSTNEELQSTNEELQSTNEELETSREELQSVNEELMTVNAEMQNKIEQMAKMQDDMKNLLDNMHVGTIFLDRHLAIRRFTRDASRVFRLMASDLGRPLADIRSEAAGSDLIADAQSVLDTLVPVERELQAVDGTWYLARIQPYRTLDNVIDGVVLTFADVTERVKAIAARKALAIAVATIETVHMPLLVTDAALNIVSANAAFYSAFGGSQQNTVGHNFFATGNGQWDFPALRDLLQTVLPTERGFERHVLQYDAPGGARRHLQFSARRIADQPGDGGLVLLAIETADPQAG
jgi:two-component system CheB/CheR fusion protein